ncbi:hypothetical protein WKW77_24890 [Variovorax ureilyticus]|uniref:Uncharacterized protein n=1 Tax=Variovorax ureilyticus TaxID=1836198 RepID=A0ABU8VL12_9BURK
METHRNISIFELHSLMLDMRRSDAGLDDAIAQLATWMDLARDHLTEDDWKVLGEIGAVLYREAIRRKARKAAS